MFCFSLNGVSSSYSSSALDFENKHKLDPVFDSPRMSRRSLRLGNTARYYSLDDAHHSNISSNASFTESLSSGKDSLAKTAKKHRSSSKQSAIAVNHTPKRSVSNSSLLSHSSYNSHVSDTSAMSTILDESLIREQTEVDHFWGLDDDDGDAKGGDMAEVQGNGAIKTTDTQTTMNNGYLCNDCSLLSDRQDVLTAFSASQMASSRVYSRDRSQRHKSRGISFYLTRTFHLVKNTASSLTWLFIQLFQTVLLKPLSEMKAHSNFCGSMNVQEFLREDGQLGVIGESLCDDCKGKKHLETHTTVHMQSSRSKRIARTFWHIFSYAGYFLLQSLRTVGSAGWFMSRKMLSFLWLAIVSPGKAASGTFWWLGTGWYQLVTLISLFNVFFLTRCLRKIVKFLLLLIPLLLALGLWYWGFEGLLSLAPFLNGTGIFTAQRIEEPASTLLLDPVVSDSDLPPKADHPFDSGRIRELEKQLILLSSKCHHHDEDYSKVTLLLQKLQEQVQHMSDKSVMSAMIMNIVNQHFQGAKPDGVADTVAIHQEYNLRVLKLEELLGKLSIKSEELQKEMEQTRSRIVRGGDEQDQHLMNKINQLELELAQIKTDLLDWQSLKTSCEKVDITNEKVDARIKEFVKMTIFGNKEELPESLLQWLSSNFVSKNSIQDLLQELELKVLKNITHHISITQRLPTPDAMASSVTAGISGITEEQAHMIVNNALKLYSQDRIGMVDFALESGGGSILSTRCSETYETKTALMSLFGIPLWYFSQSPRVVIQPDIYPGNCWAFKGSQGYLVVRLSMMIYPAAFTLEHIPKTLSPTGNITSAPKDFAVYGLENEFQEEGKLLGQFVYKQNGDPLQTFRVMVENEDPFQIVELRVFSNWGHNEYTCLYRFRVHGKPSK
ncbi:SUN domain-containing protein 1 isoform X3 [Rhinatrema bivittatum]|uniref:SUN domain-containing protein 1 isoform X3 n=1 Tax=Rhinatrema bivittatum TaxID=194408 RepID=UPI00112CF598|nr:SUN domain-containing protein 1 isoform X3 [Rhinatrema bivittatum]